MVVEKPSGPHHCATCRGLVQASNTSSRGASNARVTRISRSAASEAALVPALLPAISFLLFLPLLYLHFAQIVIQSVETLGPEPSIMRDPVSNVPQRTRREPTGPPLRVAPSRDQSRSFQHLQVFGDGRQAHLEGFGQLRHRDLARR